MDIYLAKMRKTGFLTVTWFFIMRQDTRKLIPLGAFGGYDLIVKLNKKLNPEYINVLFNSIFKEKMILPLTRRAAQPHLNARQVKSLKIYFPPVGLQNQFANKVQKLESQKNLMQQSLTELENNFNSLMQRAFKGELFYD
jgi:type I restriction enzyme, S subunit